MTIIDIYNDCVLRDTSSIAPIDDYLQILSVIKDSGFLRNHIIETQIFSKNKNILKHRKIKHIIHSSEFTESMAYDVTNIALNMSLIFLKKGIYANDLLAHNFTFENGKWILYDFCSFSYNKQGLKTQIRGTFNISFSAFELMNVIQRCKLKHYFLNRIKYSSLIKMIPFFCWLNWYINMEYTFFLLYLNKTKSAVLQMKKLLNNYNKRYKRDIYNYIFKQENEKIYEYLDNLITENSDVLCVGTYAGDWALYSKTKANKIFYTDNYTLCDGYYNYIIKNKIKNITTAVFQPLSIDEQLNNNLRYRALYDNFTKSRLISNIVFIDFDEVYDTKFKSITEFCKIISGYATDYLILKFKRDIIPANNLQNEIKKYFKSTECIDFKLYYILKAKNNMYCEKIENIKYYGNDNRTKEAKKQCSAILELIKQK